MDSSARLTRILTINCNWASEILRNVSPGAWPSKTMNYYADALTATLKCSNFSSEPPSKWSRRIRLISCVFWAPKKAFTPQVSIPKSPFYRNWTKNGKWAVTNVVNHTIFLLCIWAKRINCSPVAFLPISPCTNCNPMAVSRNAKSNKRTSSKQRKFAILSVYRKTRITISNLQI